MEEPLPIDVSERLNRDFGDRAAVVEALFLARRQIGTAGFVSDRLVRCIVQAAGGDEQRVQQLLDVARRDHRDVILAGEYEMDLQVRDLRASFLLDCPVKFWAGEVSCLMALRGYRLTSLETRPTSAGPCDYTSDYGEGLATFIGPKGKVVVEKKHRQWMLHGDRRQLEIHELERPIKNERVFRDALSSYLLSNVRHEAGGNPDDAPPVHKKRAPWWKFWS